MQRALGAVRQAVPLALCLMWAVPVVAQVPDHLKCYKVKDPLKLKGIVDLDAPQFDLEPGCTISRTKLFCVPATKTVVSAEDRATKPATPITPVPVPGPDPGDRICYQIRCLTPGPAAQQVTDQFGTRTLTETRPLAGFKPDLLCTPAVKGVPTTTTTSTPTTSTTSTTSGCPSQLLFTTTVSPSSCGGAAFGPAPTPPFSGALYATTTGGASIADLGSNCLYVGGGGNLATAPSQNPDGPPNVFTVTSCDGDTLNLAGNTASGPDTCTLGPAVTSHCTRNLFLTCTPETEVAVCGAIGLCNPDPQCYFGPPVPVPAGPTSTCVLNVFRSDASGTANQAQGTSAITLPLSSYVYLTQNPKVCTNFAPGLDTRGLCFNDANCGGTPGVCQDAPACPLCLTNKCLGGKRHGEACTPVGLKETTLECLPRDSLFQAALSVTLGPLGTGQSVMLADGTGKFCGPSQRTLGAFGKPTARRIEENGTPAGNLTDRMPHPVTIAADFCIPATGNGLIDGSLGADLPGPGAVSIRGTFTTQ